MSIVHTIAGSWADAAPAIVGEANYGDLNAAIARARGGLRARGLRAGDRVGIVVTKSVDRLALLLAALSEGIVVAPLDPRATADEIAYIRHDAGLADVVDTLDGPPAPIGPPVPDDAVALLLYTSGTTGRRKGACLTHGNVRAAVEALHVAWRWTSADVLVHTLPLAHVHGLIVAQLGALRAGAATVWRDRFDPADVLATIARDRATVVMGVPTHYHRLVACDAPFDVSSVRLFTSGSAPLPPDVFQAFEAKFGHRIVERYGMTETGIVLSNRIDAPVAGAVGFPLPGVEARVDAPPGEAGELRIRGPSVFPGYLGRPDATAAALEGGWMHTGDEAIQAPDGSFRVLGRRDDLILTGGYNVYPEEVERVLLDVPGVREVAVVGVPHADLGQQVVAAVVGDAPLDAVRAHAAAHLTPYRVPRLLARWDALPRNALGKLMRRSVRAEWDAVRIREAHREDAPRIAAWNVAMALETEAFALDPEVTTAGVHRVFDGDVGAFYLVAERGAEPVGQLMVTTEWSDWRNTAVWWIQSVYVPTAARGMGVYRALHAAVRERAATAGAAGVRLYVARENDRAAAVYRAVGMHGDRYALFEQLFVDEHPERVATGSGDPAGLDRPPG